MRFTSIASGSSGNCTYVGTEHSHILIDAGVTAKQIETGLNELELSLKDLNAIFITHEHGDHIKALGVISRKYEIPIYASLETLREIMLTKSLGAVRKECLKPILPDTELCLGDLRIRPFSIDHDAVNPLAYRIETEKESVAVATDLGHFDAYTEAQLSGLDALLLEANHDLDMLAKGPYPMQLKRRILSDHGHLSNENSGRLISRILHDGMKHIFLGHLSQENNEPELAFRTVCEQIDQAECPYCAKDFRITVACRDRLSELVLV